MNKILYKILGLFHSPTVDEQMEEYLKKYGYPKESVIFTDSRGRVSQLIGSDELLRTCERLDKIFNKYEK